MTQAQVNEAVLLLLDGHAAALETIRAAIAAGEILVEAGGTGLHLRAAPSYARLADVLEELRVQAGRPAYRTVAEAVGVSEAAISRLFSGQRLGTWPMARLVVEHLGGDVAGYRELWEEARAPRSGAAAGVKPRRSPPH